jgi:hypothetical protein
MFARAPPVRQILLTGGGSLTGEAEIQPVEQLRLQLAQREVGIRIPAEEAEEPAG